MDAVLRRPSGRGAEQAKWTWFRSDVPAHAALRCVSFAAETCGYNGEAAVRCVSCLQLPLQ